LQVFNAESMSIDELNKLKDGGEEWFVMLDVNAA
jgi:hypothetical protein